MTDKVQKIREEVEKLHGNPYYMMAVKDVLEILDMQEEPVSKIWHDASEKSNEPEDVVIINPSNNTGDVLTRCTGVYQGRIWAYTSVLLKLDDPCNFGKNLQEEPVSEYLNIESMIESYKQRLISQANVVENSPLIDMCLASYKHGINETLDTLNLSNVERTIKDRKESVSEDLEDALAREWQGYNGRGAATVDALEDNSQELAFAKGFYLGAKWKTKECCS